MAFLPTEFAPESVFGTKTIVSHLKLRIMEKVILVDGKSLHLILGQTYEEWCELYGKNICWDIDFEELIDGTLEINENIWYYYIDGRCYETDKEVELEK